MTSFPASYKKAERCTGLCDITKPVNSLLSVFTDCMEFGANGVSKLHIQN